jgi:hypothetical protein
VNTQHPVNAEILLKSGGDFLGKLRKILRKIPKSAEADHPRLCQIANALAEPSSVAFIAIWRGV